MKKVKITSRLNLFLSLLLVSAVTFIGCGNDSDDDGGMSGMTELNIVETAQENEDFSILVQAISDAGLVAALEGDGPFTVFAPTNEAFNELPEGTLESLTNEQLAQILQFHVVEGAVGSGDLEATQDVPSLLGEELLVESEGGVLVNGYSNVTIADIEASNGIIHAVDAVLLPAGIREANIIDQATELGTFNSLVGAVDQVGLTSTLKYKGDFTVFAPTDAAFAALPDGLLASLTEDQISEILTYHVLSGEIFSDQLSPEQSVEPLSGGEVFVTVNNDGVFVNGSASVVTADVDVSNGVIHAIDQVILPNQFLDVVQIAQKNYDLTTLVDLVVNAGLVSTLQGDGPFTVLAPTNDAFAEISTTLEGLTESEVEQVLLYHVAATQALAGDLTDGMTIETVQGEDITVTIDAEDNVFFNGDVGVVTVDLEGTNGVVHVIDGVLLPPSFTESSATELTLNNVGASAWEVTGISGNDADAALNTENTEVTLTVGSRFTFVNNGGSNHPLEFRNANGDVLLSENSTNGSFESDAEVNFQVNGNEISFTLTQALADEIASYFCGVHSSMNGAISVQ